MKKYKNILLTLVLLSCLIGCGKSDSGKDKIVTTQPISDNDYRIAIPYKSSDARQTHVEFNRGKEDVDSIGAGLLRYSKEHFSTSSYYLQEGQLLNRDNLQVNTYFGDTDGLLGFKSKENPYGLNPEKGQSIPVIKDEKIIAGGSTIPIIDVFEINFIQDLVVNPEIKGISLAIVLNPNVVDEGGVAHTISDENLKIYGEEAGRILVNYLKSLPEANNNTPILVGLYKASSTDESLAGSYFAVGYGKKNIDQFKEVSEEWVLFPSDNAENKDSLIQSQFNAIKKSLHQFLPNDVGVVAKGFFVDEKLNKLQIAITTQVKTHTENVAVVQYTVELLSNFTNTDFDITVKINSNLESFAMIKRDKGKDPVVVMY